MRDEMWDLRIEWVRGYHAGQADSTPKVLGAELQRIIKDREELATRLRELVGVDKELKTAKEVIAALLPWVIDYRSTVEESGDPDAICMDSATAVALRFMPGARHE